MPPPAASKLPVGSEGYVGAQLNHSRAVDIAYSSGGAEARRLNTRRRVRPVRMVEYIQEFALKVEANLLPDRNHLGDRQIVIPQVRSMQPYLRAKCAGDDILAGVGKVAAAHARGRGQKLRIDVIYEGTAAMKNTDGTLQLGYGDPVERQPAVRARVVIEGAVRPGQIEGKTGLVREDRSQSPAPNHLVQNVGTVEQGLALAKRKIIRPAGMDDMSQVKSRRAVR